jgi:cell division protein FtsB
MAPTPESPRPRPRRTPAPEPLRRKQIQLASRASSAWRRALSFLLIFAIAVLLADALVGERGLIATTRARKQSEDLTSKVEQLRRENSQLRDTARRLREDRTTIESMARKDLGLIRQGEVLVVVKDVKGTTK